MEREAQESLRYTPNQVVAYNLRRARVLRGWSQEETAIRLEEHLGVRWSNASYSVAERSTDRPERIRNFTADEIVAFARTFRLPVTWFFFPPDVEQADQSLRIAPPAVGEEGALSPQHMLEVILGDPETQALLGMRVDETLKGHPVDSRGPYLGLLDKLVSLHSQRAISQSLGDDLDQWVEGLRGLVVRLEAARTSTVDTLQSTLNRAVGDYYEEILENPTTEPGADAGPR